MLYWQQMDLQEALEAALERQRRLQHDREALDEQLADLEIEVRGLRMALERHLGREDIERTVAERATRLKTALDSQRVSRTDAILGVLRRAGRPMSPTEIREALHELGREDEYNAVSAALAHLAKSERAQSIGRAQWVAGRDSPWLVVETEDGRVVRRLRHAHREPDAEVVSESEVETNS
jgi:DNA repair exonuclease SbcCD ATPase subunit